MSHIAALMVDIVAPIGCAGSVYYADKSALKGTLLQTLQVRGSADNNSNFEY